jgi:diguanylate cyclase (GGDEF)-like protein
MLQAAPKGALSWNWQAAEMADLPRILVVDDSRMVRLTLIKHLKGQYEVREESDGEAAWQTLVLDQTLQAVISDLQMPKLDGYGLLENLRSSKLRRLKEMPFILVSGEETEEERERARSLGVSDFVTKGAGSSEILARLNNLLALSAARQNIEADREGMVQDPRTGLFSRKYLELQAAQALAHAARYGLEVSILVLGFDKFEQVRAKLGNEVAEQVGSRFVKMLAAKVRQEDSLGHYGAGQYAIIAPGTSPALCAAFAERVREAVEVARVSVQSGTISLTVSVGLASIPGDTVHSAVGLLELAGERMNDAMLAGGNRIVTGDLAAASVRQMTLQHAVELITARREEVVLPHLGALGVQVLPLLRLLNQDLGLELPLAEIERRLQDRAANKK